jgi:pimeloyl-ACP methyl ester carboxylesterase
MQNLAMTILIALAMGGYLSAQDRSGAGTDEPPEPREVELTTKDNVGIRAGYFPAIKSNTPNQGKDAITVLIVHEWKGQARPYQQLCFALQNAGFAVLIPEFRGHGGSRDYTDPAGVTKRFNIARMSKRDIENIIRFDLETSKGFLKEENNKGNLNLNALVVLGVQEGCVLAAHWAQRDWNFPSVGRIKQGQDVKALIMISPEKQIKGLALDPMLSDRNLIQLPMMIAAGGGKQEAGEAEIIARRVEGMKKRLARGPATGFRLLMPDTKLSGPRLVNDVPEVVASIIDFISSEVRVSDGENPWVERM